MSDVAHRVVVYYQTQYDQSQPPTTPYGFYVSPIPLIHLITHLIVASFHLNLNNASSPIHLNDNAPTDPMFTQMWKDVATLQADGVKVTGLLGGAAPGTYDCLTPDQFDRFYPILRNTIEEFKLDGLDLDVEQDVALSDIERLIRTLREDFGQDFIITLAPVASALLEEGNISGFDYLQLEQQMGSEINWYNAQFYSGFGSIFPDDQYINITKYGAKIEPARLVAGTLTNPNNGNGYVDPNEVVKSIRNLIEMFGNAFGGVAGWEYFDSNPQPRQPQQWAQLMTNTMRDVEKNSSSSSTTTSTSVNTTGNANAPVPLRKKAFGDLGSELLELKRSRIGFARRHQMAARSVQL